MVTICEINFFQDIVCFNMSPKLNNYERQKLKLFKKPLNRNLSGILIICVQNGNKHILENSTEGRKSTSRTDTLKIAKLSTSAVPIVLLISFRFLIFFLPTGKGIQLPTEICFFSLTKLSQKTRNQIYMTI